MPTPQYKTLPLLLFRGPVEKTECQTQAAGERCRSPGSGGVFNDTGPVP